MVLNWSPEVIVDFIVGTMLFIGAFITFIAPKAKKLKSLFWIGNASLFTSLFLYLEAISVLFMNLYLNFLHTLSLFFILIFFMIGINYIKKESFASIDLFIVFGIGIFYCILGFQPEMYAFVIEGGYPTIAWTGLLLYYGNGMQIITMIYIFYWGYKTWRMAPFLIKKESLIFFIGIFLATIVNISIFMFTLWIPTIVLLADSMLAIGWIMFILSIVKEPKLLYILPFTIYRITVRDNNGITLFDHDWSNSEISEKVFSGFLNALQLMSDKVMRVGNPVDIHLEEGVLILRGSKFISVGLVASKSSQLLRDSVEHFSVEFEEKFERILKQSCKVKEEYYAAYELLEKYFSNFPYSIIKDRKSPLQISTKIPFELENKLGDIFKDDKELEFIKAELLKSPMSLPEDFLYLYDELKAELAQEESENILEE